VKFEAGFPGKDVIFGRPNRPESMYSPLGYQELHLRTTRVQYDNVSEASSTKFIWSRAT
jgi:hypothetical protein